MSEQRPVVYLVDDDASVLKSLGRLLGAWGFETRLFNSPRKFLAEHDPGTPGCVVLDLTMPDIGGLELQRQLSASGRSRPIIFITGQGDIPASVSAMKAGAVDFLTKPFDERDLLQAINTALAKDKSARDDDAELANMRTRLSKLTHRERQVLAGVIGGQLNKQIAGTLGIVEKTVKVHRGRAMTKMGVRSVAELVRVAHRLGIAPESAREETRSNVLPAKPRH